MPNYNLVIDTSNFKPYDYSNALALLREIRDANYRTEEITNKIQEERGKYLLPEDSKYSQQQKSFWEDFDTASENFYNNSNLETMNAIKKMRNRYNAEMVPIGQAVEKYNKAQDTILKLGPDAIIGNKQQLDNLDSYYGGLNPQIDYRSASQIQTKAARYFSGINNALMQDPTFKKILGDQYYLQTQKGGLDGNSALKTALIKYNERTGGEHTEAIQNMLDHMQHLMDAEGVDKFSDDAKNQVWNNIVSGLVSSIEAPKYNQTNNRGYETPSDKRQMAYQEVQMAKSGYIYNPSTGKYEYDAEAAATAGGTIQTATLPDGSVWNYDPRKKQWTSSDQTWDGIPRTSAQLIAEEKRQLQAKQKEKEAKNNTLWKRSGEKQLLTDNAYLTIGEQFEPFEFKMDDYTGTDDEKGIRASGFKRLSAGGNGFNGATSGAEFDGISLAEAKLPADTKTQILREAQRQIPNLTLADLVLYVDQDYWSDDHIRVCIRGTGERGNYIVPETTGTTTRDSQPQQNDSISLQKPQGLQ